MWIVVLSKDLSSLRDNVINSLLANDSVPEEYLACSVRKYRSTQNIEYCKIYKTISGANRLIKRFNSDTSKRSYSNSFNWISDKHLSVRKLTITEWNSIINYKIKKIASKYEYSKSLLEKKRNQYK